MGDPNTQECMLTFMGTNNTADWLSNALISVSHFCGYTYPHETCVGRGVCQVEKPGGSFTHWGFTNRLRTIIQDPKWQKTVLNNLGGCSKVYVAGHSAGGAMGSMFQACLANAPKEGEAGHDTDYQYMKWVRGEPRQLPYVQSML